MARTSMRLAGGIVGALVVVEASSGVIQGYYTPLLTDIARHLGIHDADVNWFEAAQLLLSAIVVPVLARLGDMVGHRKVLLGSLALTAAASWAIAFSPTFPLFIVAWALQGFYVVWLPLNVAIIHTRARDREDGAALTRRGAGVIVMALQAGAILGAVVGGQLGGILPLWAALSIPAAMVTLAGVVVLVKVPDTGARGGGRIDSTGTVVLTLALLAIMGGLSVMRRTGFSGWVVLLVAVGLALLWVFVRVERRSDDPLVDMTMLRRPTMWPVILTSALFGVSVLGAQAPLSTFARTDPATVGYGLGLTSATAGYLIGAYVLSLLIGAGVFARLSQLMSPRIVLIGASLLVAAGYLSLIPFHSGVPQVVACMVVAGLGSGMLVAALPAAAAAAAPSHQTAVATGLTNTTKTIGGAFASTAFAIALASGVAAAAGDSTAGSLSGYVTVWAICGVTALVATGALLTVPKVAFTHNTDAKVAEAEELL
ncbi:MFS transporter [Demequina sp. SYSU T00039]|uniref:MFS transporter n=1 Tax=Demequina lignilytica TaxID=3051663 RepID=A0AAW7MA60_9MICO|nr:MULTISPECIES: MFS transporter [unclassified Demequina]MDN4478594.1 MFS transporter [Demequina sp. SYSU T00039-1]MDN4488572.1 MFS transporter [Demequina sp. SYSU T00039]